MKTSRAASKPATLDAYLAQFPAPQKAALQKLRRAILAAAPGATEGVSYGVGAFYFNDRFLVGLGAAKKHCAFYLGSAIKANLEDLEGYNVSAGTVRFQPEKPLPPALVKKLVQSRIVQPKKAKAKPAAAKPAKKVVKKAAVKAKPAAKKPVKKAAPAKKAAKPVAKKKPAARKKK